MTPRALLFAAWALVGGCATADGMQEKLYDSSRAYNRAMRWADYDSAARYVPSAWIESFLDEHERLARDIIIVDYELTRLGLNRQDGTAESRVSIMWHTERRLVVETTVLAQAWQWHEGSWLLVDERVLSGEPLAFVPDSTVEEHPYLPGLARFREVYGIGSEDERETGVSTPTAAPGKKQHISASRAPKS